MLHVPGTAEPTPWQAAPGWNGKLAYTFGGACGVGYWQGSSTGGVENDLLLTPRLRRRVGDLQRLRAELQRRHERRDGDDGQGARHRAARARGPTRSASAAPPARCSSCCWRTTTPASSTACSARSATPTSAPRRSADTTAAACRTTGTRPAGAGWTDAEKVAVTGHALSGTCFGFTFFDGVDDPNRGCNSAIPVADRWSPANPDGLRCTIADMVKNVYGVGRAGPGAAGRARQRRRAVRPERRSRRARSPSTSSSRSTRTSAAWTSTATAPRRARRRASRRSSARSRPGAINMMTGGLASIPVIEIRRYTDPTGDFHERYRSAIIRERMLAAYGDADTHVNWTSPNVPALYERRCGCRRSTSWRSGSTTSRRPADRRSCPHGRRAAGRARRRMLRHRGRVHRGRAELRRSDDGLQHAVSRTTRSRAPRLGCRLRRTCSSASSPPGARGLPRA